MQQLHLSGATDESTAAFYGGHRPVELPLYSMAAASRYVSAPASTIRWWVRGRQASGYEPVISTGERKLLSFNDLVELFVVRQLRRVHGVSLENIRLAVGFASSELGVERVLLSQDLRTFGDSVLLRHLGSVVAISKGGQLALEEIIGSAMRRIELGKDHHPVALYPSFVGETELAGRPPVTVSPYVAFGSPTVSGTSIKTSVLAAIADSGLSADLIAEDYSLPTEAVRNAIIFENAA